MADIFIVMGINLLVWIGIFSYLLHLQSKINKLDQLISNQKEEKEKMKLSQEEK